MPGGLGLASRHEGSPAGIGFDQPLFAESFHRLPDRAAAHAKLQRQFSLGWQLVAWLQLASGN
jgi:hypothetical protein